MGGNQKGGRQKIRRSKIDEVLEIVRFMVDTGATKDDLKGFATKEDLKRFATKEDLKQFATKDDLKQFATKDDLTREIRRLENNIAEHVDSFVGMHMKMDTEITALKSASKRHEGYFENIQRHTKIKFA